MTHQYRKRWVIWMSHYMWVIPLFRNRLLSRQKSFRSGIHVLRRSTKFWSKFWLGRRFENYQTQVRVSLSVRGSIFKVGPIPDGYLANVEARQRRNQLQNEQAAQGAMTSHGVMTSQQTTLQIQPTQTHTQPTITPVITPHVYVSQFFYPPIRIPEKPMKLSYRFSLVKIINSHREVILWP